MEMKDKEEISPSSYTDEKIRRWDEWARKDNPSNYARIVTEDLIDKLTYQVLNKAPIPNLNWGNYREVIRHIMDFLSKRNAIVDDRWGVPTKIKGREESK